MKLPKRSNYTRLMLLVILIVFSNCLVSQNSFKEKLDQFISSIDKYKKGMASISIFKDGKEVYKNAYGFADIKNSIRNTSNTKFRIGSVTKTFTATIIMQLIEENKLTLKTPLSDFYPKIPNAKKITIEHLLRHRSGLFNYTDSEDFLSWYTKPETKAGYLKKFITNGTVFQPNKKAAYSNTGYTLLGYIVEDIEKKKFSEVLKTRLFIPYNLENTSFRLVGKLDIDKGEALSYKMNSTIALSKEHHMSRSSGAGGILSTPKDLNIFFNLLFSRKVVSNKSLTKMKKIIDGFGIGLEKYSLLDLEMFGHDGSIDEFRSIVTFFPKENVSLAYISNGQVLPMPQVIQSILSIYFGKNEYVLPNLEPDTRTVQILESGDLDVYLGMYIGNGMKVLIFKEGNQLFGSPEGSDRQFLLEAVGVHKFRNTKMSLDVEFIPKENKMIQIQRGTKWVMVKK